MVTLLTLFDFTKAFDYLHFSSNSLEMAMGKIGEDIAVVESWASRNCLKLNVTKTKAMLLGSATYVNRISSSSKLKLSLYGSLIEFVDCATDLGVTIINILN
ncbi:hypothetical protein ALC57_08626 [Trachymyrmex cornetzi]|uniref:Reverse transcriptase domain-containing protein n=1 Tax=Trachymyrmex cornetzi TaxID=471704 RepID=A0A195E1E3_9HYME|nr:hypothetical protein ALC57_08626 [Trachymyrmex cornetzi]